MSLTKADRATPAGRELLALLSGLSTDGRIRGDELERLRAWLDANREVPLQARAFLSSVVGAISQHAEVTESDLDAVQLAIERVLPPDVRFVATLERRRAGAEREKQKAIERAADKERRAAERKAEQEAKRQARERDRPLDYADFVVAGATRSSERRDACEGLDSGDAVLLERDHSNPEDDNAILVLSEDGGELGYVPRDDARRMAPLLDAGARADARVKKLLETSDGYVLPVVVSRLYRADAQRSQDQSPGPVSSAGEEERKAAGCGCAGCGLVVLLLFAAATLAFCTAA